MCAAILASGDGSNAEAIVRWSFDHADRLKVCGIFTDNPQAGVIARAKKLGVPVDCLPFPEKESDRDSFMLRKQRHERSIAKTLQRNGVEWLLLAGYMRILSPAFLSDFSCNESGIYRVINIHPSLLPDFPGKDAMQRAFTAGVAQSGVTVHLVDEGIDTGTVLVQESFPRFRDDDFQTFSSRGKQLEHKLYVRALEYLTQSEAFIQKS
jgi:phosphoribosylglycinamide formyltransferase-1